MIEFDFSAIRNAVVKMLTVNMGLKAGERVLFLSDVPTMNDWYAGQDFITDFSMRTLTTRAACEIAKEEFPDNTVDLYCREILLATVTAWRFLPMPPRKCWNMT